MTATRKYRWRKATDINREHALFEMLADDIVLADLGFSDTGVTEIVFHEGIVGLVLDWSLFRESVEEGMKLAEQDR
jgi:hypothetical protein